MYTASDLSFYIISLGCSKNLVDSERINGCMKKCGFNDTESAEDADILIIHTCGFITPAKEESIEVILDALDERDVFNDTSRSDFTKKVVVTGCLSERYFTEIKKDIPEIDFVYGLPDQDFIKEFCSEFDIEIQDNLDVCNTRSPIFQGLPYSYIKIAEGCSNNCSFCAIPLIRGPFKSISPEEIIADAVSSVSQGAKELVIIAQDIGVYHWESHSLSDVVQSVSEIEGVEWIRLLYCHPDHLSDDIIRLIAENEKVVKYIDLPFQHVSEKILNSMNRKGNRSSCKELVRKIREAVPDIRIRSTFMVGYPGETNGDFEELMAFIKEMKLDRVGCFTYSPEENTPAEALGDPVPSSVKEERQKILMETQQKISSEKLESMIGSVVNVIVEERFDKNTFICRTEYDAPEVDGVFYLTTENAVINSIIKAIVTDSIEYDLIGEPV